MTFPLAPLPLWPDNPPDALGTAEHDVPTLTAYLPDPAQATGAAVVICPGGGYQMLAEHEGRGYAEWLAAHGVAGIVLKYRLAPHGYRHPTMWRDGLRAMRLTRANAAAWKIDPARVAIMGSSAGGHLAATVLTHHDAGQPGHADPVERHSSRPDLGILCYAVISMTPLSHPGSRENLLGTDPAPELVEFLSAEKQVTADTPSCFVWHTWEDAAVKVENAILFAAALREKGVRSELHVYELGVHGIGLGTPQHRWTADCLAWLGERGFLTRSS